MSQADASNSTNTSRRRFLAAGTAAVVFGALHEAVASEARSPVDLQAILAELETIHARRDEIDADCWRGETVEDEDDRLFNRHWELREIVQATRACSPSDLKVKARATEMALLQDPDAECGGAGSFVELTRSLIRDLLAL